MNRGLFALTVLSSFAAQAALASPDESVVESAALELSPKIDPKENYLRTQSVFEYFKLESEPDSQKLLQDMDRRQTLEGLQKLLPYMDLDGQFSRYLKIDGALVGYRDRDSKEIQDFKVVLADLPSAVQTTDFEKRLQAAKLNPPHLPLKGLRIALDPGHMGGEYWDKMTGKYVKDRRGRILSEGVMALQTSLMLEKELQALGADVFVTHRKLEAVTDIDFESYDLNPFARRELRYTSLEPWFQSLVESTPAGNALYQAFLQHASYKRLYTSAARQRYFVSRADLDARARAIQAYAPDITLIIHYDTSDPPGNSTGVNPNRYSKTKVYVTGGYRSGEFAALEDRAQFARHLLHQKEWEASVQLSQSIVNEIHDRLKIDFDTNGGTDTKLVVPGVFARNLAIPRKLRDHPVAYVECMHYNDPVEFERFLVNYPNSSRLLEVVGALKTGVLKFVKNYH